VRYRVTTTSATVAQAEPTETIYDSAEDAAELFTRLLMLDSSLPRNTSFRLITAFLRGDDSFTALGHTNHYTLQRVP
jgi:hypothetical protein